MCSSDLPEMLKGRGRTRASDWWAVGVFVFELLTGHPPFEGDKPSDIFDQISDYASAGDKANQRLADLLVQNKVGAAIPITHNCAAFVTSLLRAEEHKRLGCAAEGFLGIQQHPWFDGFDWAALIKREMQPPHTPQPPSTPFAEEELEPYLEQVFSLLFSLLKEVNECDTKLNVLNVLSYLIERVGVSIRPICSALLHYLPTLWEESASHNMLRCSILSTLVFIVQGLGTVSEGLLPFLGPVLELSTDLSQDSHIYLLEDGLELWLTLLHNTARPYDSLLALLPRIPPLLQMGSENLRTTIYILQAYVLLCPGHVMETVGPAVVAECAAQYADLQDEGVLMILRLVETWLRAGPPHTPQVLEPLLLRVMEAVHEGRDFPMLMSLHLSILSRLMLASHSLFAALCLSTATKLGSNHNDVAGKVLDVWCDKMPCVTAPERRKLLALALASLLTTESPVVLSRVYIVFLNLAETLNDVTRPDEGGGAIDSLMAGVGDAVLDTDDIDYETEHDSRKRQIGRASCRERV